MSYHVNLYATVTESGFYPDHQFCRFFEFFPLIFIPDFFFLNFFSEFAYRQIMEDPPRIPRRLELNTQRFLKRLLTKDPDKRLGSPNLGGHKAIRDHSFFKDIDWFNTYLRKTQPPLFSYITRSIDSELDLAHFDNLPAKDDLESGKLYQDDDDEMDTDDNDVEYNQLFKNFSYCDSDFI